MTATQIRNPAKAPGAPGGRVPRKQARPPWDGASAGASAVAVLLCMVSLHGVFEGWSWFAPLALTSVAVVSAMAAARHFRFPTAAVPAAGLAALVVVLTWLFASSRAFFGLIPTGDTLEHTAVLLSEAQATIMNQVPPVLAEPGIVFVACLGTGLIALLVDTLATTLRMPAASGLGLLSLLIVPAILKPESVGVLPFVLAAAGYLLVLATGTWQERPGSAAAPARRPPRRQVGTAAGIGAVALVAALALPAVLPGFTQGTFPQGSRLNLWTGGSGLNPVVALGNDLRQPSATGRIRYATDSAQAVYLRSTTLEDFSGQRWAPDLRTDSRRAGLQGMSPLEDDRLAANAQTVTTQVTSESYASPWLLAPYAPASVYGAAGKWSWDPKTMTVIAEDQLGSPRLSYEVQSLSPQITPSTLEQIRVAPENAVDPVFTDLPADVPESIREAVETATATAQGPYEQAMAIQGYLRGPEFTYSLDAPVEGGYDGNGMGVLDRFMEEKSGYCTHYAAAMAVMAREAGIPSRMALGFAPGRTTGNTVTGTNGTVLREYEVDSRDAHAWPELYFHGMGWVRFEPTPSRGSVPAYSVQPRPDVAQALRDEPRELERPAPAATAPSAPAPTAPADAAPVAPAETGAGRFLGVAAGVLAAAGAVLAPWALRRRRRTLRRRWLDGSGTAGGAGADQRSGPATLAWDEAADTGLDYGHVPRLADSPRAFAQRLAHDAGLPEGAAMALERLRSAYEQEAYAAPGLASDSRAAGSGATGSGATGSGSAGSVPGAGASDPERLWADVSTVRESFAASARPGKRLRALLFPASLSSRLRR